MSVIIHSVHWQINFVRSFLANVNSRTRSLYVVVRPSVCLSIVCLSVVCNVRAPYSGD